LDSWASLIEAYLPYSFLYISFVLNQMKLTHPSTRKPHTNEFLSLDEWVTAVTDKFI